MTVPFSCPSALRAALVAALIYLCFFSHGGALGLLGPDEPRYAAIAREMAASGDWVTPRLHGAPWFEKPILYYWTAAVSFSIFGVSEQAARLPSALAATLAVLMLAWLARRFYGASTAWIVLLLFPACVAAIGFARAATTDMLFSAALSLAMAAAARLIFPASVGTDEAQSHSGVEPPHSKVAPAGRRAAHYGWVLAWGMFLGIAALAKGPVAVLLAAGSVAVWALATQRWRDSLRLMHPLGIATFAVVAAPWYVLCSLRNPEFFQVFFISHNFERYLTPVFQHQQPFWFFGPILLLGLIPWTTLLIAPARDAVRLWREKRWQGSPAFFIACWVIFPVLFFSLSRSKLPGYILPAVPPLALLVARSVARAITEKNATLRWLTTAVGATFIALAVSAGYWMGRLPQESAPAIEGAGSPTVWIVCVAAAGAAIAALGFQRRAWAALCLSALLIAGLVEGFNRRFVPALDAHLSPRAAAQVVSLQQDAADARVYQLHRAWYYGLNFYLNRELPQWHAHAGNRALIITNDAGILNLLTAGYGVRVVRRISRQAIVVRIEPGMMP